jgi:hypothetical protein
VLLDWWKDFGRVKQKYSKKNLFQCYPVYHTPYMHWTAMEAVVTAVDICD